MGRLFWKFLLCIWLAQLTAMLGVGVGFWMRDQAHVRQQQLEMPPPGPPPDQRMPPRMHRPPHHPGILPPIEIVLANVLVSLGCAGGLAWYFSKPIRSLRHALDAAAEGDLGTRLTPAMDGRRDELADLGLAFDRMAAQLQASMHSQRHLLHDVSHELRSPLARLQAAIGLARQSPEKLQTTLERIELESARIDRLVDELLTISRLEGGAMSGPQEDIAMDELLADIVADARFEAGPQELDIAFESKGEMIVHGRAELLYRAIENIVRNAIKHTPHGGHITIGAELDGDMVRLSVADTGPGVPAADLERIFEPFFRSAAGNGNNGHGLGLALARRVMLAHGGSICARNRDGGGLCVDIVLPLAPA